MGRVDLLSVVVPMYNEQEGIVRFCVELRQVLDLCAVPYEVLFVDDASSDSSVAEVLSLGWQHVQVVSLASNVGHQRAIDAGILESRGNWVVTMDADGQHPPALIPEMTELAQTEDLDVVYTRRISRREESGLRRLPALVYYRIIRFLTGIPIADSQADFRLMSRSVIEHLSDVRGDRVLRLLLPASGVRSKTLDYVARERIAGSSRYGLSRQIRLAIDSALGFSSKPLRMVAVMGWVVAAFAFLWLLGVVITYLVAGTVAGWASVMAAVLLVGGMSLLGQAIIGSYVARIHDLVRNEPRFFIRATYPKRASDG